MGLINIGDMVRVSSNFVDTANTSTDPNTVVFKMKEPNNTVTTYTFGVNAQMVKESTGNYHVDWLVGASGFHVYNYRGNGVANAAEEASFMAVPSQF
jgi:hypothetical protein